MNKNRKIILTLVIALLLTAIVTVFTGCEKNNGGPTASNGKVTEIYISKSDLPRLDYVQGQDLDVSAGKLTAVVGGEEKKLPLNAPEVTITGYDKETLGEQTVTVTYSELTTTFKVNVLARTVAEKFETRYFVGDVFNASKGKIRITSDDAKTFYVNMNDEKVSLVSFDSSKAGTVPVTLLYNDGTNSYYCQFDVMVYEKSNVEFKAPTKVEYLSHEEGINVSGGYFTVTAAEDETLTLNVPLTADMVTGFDLSAATIANRTTPLEQTLTVTYLDKTFTYTVKIQFSGVSAINYYASNALANIDWTKVKEEGLSAEASEAALAAINEYYELSDANVALLSDEVKTLVARAAAVAVQKLFNDELPNFADAFRFENGNIYFANTTFDKTAAAVEKLVDPEEKLNVYAQLLRKIETDFAEVILVDDQKISDYIVIYDENMDTKFKEVLTHLVDVFKLIKDVPAEWNAETLKAHGDSLLSATMQIYNAGYYKSGYYTYYTKILSSWRENNDVFDILYTYFLYDYENGADFMRNYMWGSMPMPGPLEQWYMGLMGSITYSSQFKNYGTSTALFADLTAYMYNYFYTLELCEEIKKSENQFWIDIYNTFNGDYMNRTYMYTYSYGYLTLTNAMVDSEAYSDLWQKYYEVLKFYYSNELSATTHKDQLCAMFDAFEALDPTELVGFLSSLNLRYTNVKGQYPALGYTEVEGSESGQVYNVFALILFNNYGSYFNKNTKDLFEDLLSAMESFALVNYKDGAIDEFNAKMEELSKAVAALSEEDLKNFREYCGTSYDKYFELYEITSGKVTPKLTDEENALCTELVETLKKYFVVYANIYAVLQQGNKVADDAYPILYALYARASMIREQIIATGSEDAILALYTLEYDINSVKYTLEKAYYLADNITSSALVGMSAVLTSESGVTYVTYWDIYAEFGVKKLLSDMCDLLYAAYFTDGKAIDFETYMATMKEIREYDKLTASIFTLLNIDDTFYRSLSVFYYGVLSEEGYAVSQSLIIAQRVYDLYVSNKTANAEYLTAFISSMEAIKPEYEKLSEAEKNYLSDIYEYCTKLLEEVQKDA